jgi:CubicO group peptidase (beta-lactamase class C family)
MNQIVMMHGFPPVADGQVTLGNWRKPPFNRWAFKHVREIVPSAEIASDPANIRPLPDEEEDLSALRVDWKGETLGLDAVQALTDTDGLVILRRGKIIHEFYGNDTTASTQHILMSVSKSILGLIAGILCERGILDTARPVTDLIPEVSGTAYAGATIRDLLDMRAGVLFDENYLASAGPIIEYRKAQGWDPVGVGEQPTDLRSFYAAMTEPDGTHSDRFHYVSPNTDLLGWVIERTTGERYADLVSDLLWKPMGAERDAYITVDRLGAPRCAGGFCATTRDLARLGLLIAEGGAHAGRQIVPSSWLADIETAGDAAAWSRGDFVSYFPGLPIHYRSKWYVLRGDAPMFFGVGVFGQNVFVDPKNSLVIAKFSSHAMPMDEERIALTTQAIGALRTFLAR